MLPSAQPLILSVAEDGEAPAVCTSVLVGRLLYLFLLQMRNSVLTCPWKLFVSIPVFHAVLFNDISPVTEINQSLWHIAFAELYGTIVWAVLAFWLYT